MCTYSSVLIYGLAACIFVSCFQGAESVVPPTLSVTSDNPGHNCGTSVVLQCTIITSTYDGTDTKFWNGPPNDNLLIRDDSKYIEDLTNAAANNWYTLTVTQFSLSDGGEYKCTYGFDGESNPVTLNYECYLPHSTTDPVSPVDACENGEITINVDKVYPDIPTTTLTVAVTDSSNTAVPGTVTRVEHAAGTTYDSHFLLTWTSTSSTLVDGTYTYDVGITTSSGGTEVSLATGASVPCGTVSVSTISVASNNPGLNCGTNVVLECTIPGPYSASEINKYWEGPPSTTPLTVDGVKYVENEVATTKYSLTVTDFSLADVGEYTCTYKFEGTSNPAVTLNYECYLTPPVAACENGVITIKVDKVYPDIPTTTLTVAVTNSSGTPVPGTMTSVASTAYPSRFLLTWTSTSTDLADGTYTYTVGITTSIGGPEVSLATDACIVCASQVTGGGLTTGAIVGIVVGCLAGIGFIIGIIVLRFF